MIILEGPDGAGKTYLKNQILQAFPDLPLAPKAMASDITPNIHMVHYIEEWTNKQRPSDVLFDRFALISGPLYAPILDDKYQLNIYSSLRWMRNQHATFYGIVRPLIIYCLPPISTVRDNVRGDPENAKAAPYIERIYAAYVHRAAVDDGYPYSYIYDYTEVTSGHKPQPLQRMLALIEATRERWRNK